MINKDKKGIYTVVGGLLTATILGTVVLAQEETIDNKFLNTEETSTPSITYEIKEKQNDLENLSSEIKKSDSYKNIQYILSEGRDLMSENLILAWINQESSMSQDAELRGCIGFTQASAISLRDVINRNTEKYEKYLSYTPKELRKALKDDVFLNLKVGFDYMNLLKTAYGFSQEKVKSNYKYIGNEEDILLMAYNAGPTVTKDILTEFKNNGGGGWDDLEDFLYTDEALNIFKKYKRSYGVKDNDALDKVNAKIKRKIEIMINYVNNIKKNANK